MRVFDAVEQYDPYIDVVCQDVDKILRIALSYGCHTVVAVPPWQSPALLDGAVERLADRVAATTEECGRDAARYVGTLRLKDDLTARRLWQPDGVHWNDDGNRLIADRLIEELLSMGWLRASPSSPTVQTPPTRQLFEDRK